ncbi:hypothetical protein BCR36DRAFT_334476, partial [Piromyces finnis]
MEWFLFSFVNHYLFNKKELLKRITKYQNDNNNMKSINNRVIFKNVIELCIKNANKYINIQQPLDADNKYTLFNGLVRIGIVQLLNNIDNGSQYFHQIATKFEDESSFKYLFQKIIPENKLYFEEDIDIILKILMHKSNSVLNKKTLINSLLHLISSFSCFNSIIQVLSLYPILKSFDNILKNVSLMSFEDYPYSIPQNILIICSMIIQTSIHRKSEIKMNLLNQLSNCTLIESIIECGIIHSIKNITIMEKKIRSIKFINKQNNNDSEDTTKKDNNKDDTKVENSKSVKSKDSIENNENSEKDNDVNNDNDKNNINEDNVMNQDVDSKVREGIPTNFEVLIEVKADKIIDNRDINNKNESLEEAEINDEKDQLESPKTIENESESEKELMNNIMKYFSIIESSLDTLYLFSIHLNEEAPKKNRNSSISNVSKTNFNSKIIKLITNYNYQSKTISDNNTTKSFSKFSQILEN